MGIEHCLTVRMLRICEIQGAADKTLTQRLFNMSVTRLPPVRLRNEQRGKNTTFFELRNYRIKDFRF